MERTKLMKKYLTLLSFIACVQMSYGQILEKAYYDRWLYEAMEEPTFDSLQQTLNGFFATRAQSFMNNDYWVQEDFEEYVAPFRYLCLSSSHDYWTYDTPLVPYVMSIDPVEDYNKYHLLVTYLGHLDSAYEVIYSTYHIMAVKDTSGNYKLKHPEAYLTKDWQHYDYESLHYVVNPVKEFNKQEAMQMDSANRHIAAFFHTDVLEVTYFSCGSIRDFWRIQGEEIFGMTGRYDTLLGGGVGDGLAKRIYSANRSEYYPHELVHIYMNDFNNRRVKKDKLAYEGIPTFLGGSAGKSLEHHLKNVAVYAKEHNIDTLDKLLEIRSHIQNEETDTVYAIGGLIAKMVDAKEGYKGLIELFNTPKGTVFDYVAKLYDMPAADVDEYLYSELMKYL